MKYPHTDPEPATIDELINLMAITHREPNAYTTDKCKRFVGLYGESEFRRLVAIHAETGAPIHIVFEIYENLNERIHHGILEPIPLGKLLSIEDWKGQQEEKDRISVPKKYSRNKRFNR